MDKREPTDLASLKKRLADKARGSAIPAPVANDASEIVQTTVKPQTTDSRMLFVQGQLRGAWDDDHEVLIHVRGSAISFQSKVDGIYEGWAVLENGVNIDLNDISFFRILRPSDDEE